MQGALRPASETDSLYVAAKQDKRNAADSRHAAPGSGRCLSYPGTGLADAAHAAVRSLAACGLLSVLLFIGCGDNGAAGIVRTAAPATLPEPLLWETPDIDPPRAAFLDRMAHLRDVSTWAYRASAGSGQEGSASADLPYLGTGNGSVCCLVGTTRPLHTIHELFGPTYQRGETALTFPDIRWVLKLDDKPLSFEQETIWRVRRSAVVLTRGLAPGVEMWTVTFAPFPAAWPGAPSPECRSLFRLVYLKNLTAAGIRNLSVGVKLPGRWGEVSEGTLVSVSEDRRLRILPLGREGTGAGRALFVPLELAAGEEAGLAFALVTSSPAYPEEPALRAVEGLTLDLVEQELGRTVLAWRSWYAGGAHLETPDPRVTDLLEGLVVTDKVQTTVTGGPVQSSHYSLVWNRDTYGPMRLFTATARIPESKGILDYHFIAVRHRQGLANAYRADYDPSTAPPPPTAAQWAAMGTFSGRTAAEGPSFLVLNYDRYLGLRGTLDDFQPADLASRLDMLRACVYQQALTPEGLLPFSGDETFRPQMAMSFGLGIEYPFEDRAWSFQSNVLLAAAAEALARIEEAVAPILGSDPAEPAARARGLAQRVREATLEHYWNEAAGYFEPFLLKTQAGSGTLPARPGASDYTPAGAPYGDVNAVPFWVDTDLPGVDAEAVADLLARRLLSRHHVFFSPADPTLRLLLGFLIGEGLYTGMTPGLTIWTLATAGHPQAEAAFNSLDDHADPGGNYPEVVVHDRTSPLMPIYDTSGLIGEMWARYRSWEGGINGEALLYFLSGFRADAVCRRLELAPRLPNRWPSYRLTGLKIGEGILDLGVERTSLTGMRVALDLRGGEALLTRLRIPGPPLVSASLNGRSLGTGFRTGNLWGGTASDLGGQPLGLGANLLLLEFADPPSEDRPARPALIED